MAVTEKNGHYIKMYRIKDLLYVFDIGSIIGIDQSLMILIHFY